MYFNIIFYIPDLLNNVLLTEKTHKLPAYNVSCYTAAASLIRENFLHIFRYCNILFCIRGISFLKKRKRVISVERRDVIKRNVHPTSVCMQVAN